VCAICCTALLWRAIHSPFMWGFEHVESKCGHVSMALLGHSVQFEFGCKLGHKKLFTVVTHILGISQV
jgi:hypothetical protein